MYVFMLPLQYIVSLSYVEQFLQTHIVSNVKRLYKNAKYFQIKLYKKFLYQLQLIHMSLQFIISQNIESVKYVACRLY